MAEKDIRAKRFESNPDVFASIFNGLLFRSDLINPEGLIQVPTESSYEDDRGNVRIQSRDVAMSYSEAGITNHFGLAIFGTENQTNIDEIEAVRVMGYDYGSYRTQVDYYKSRIRFLKDLLTKATDSETKSFIQDELNELKEFSLVPAITIVLNFNKKRWDKPKNLVGMVSEQNKFRKWMKDYSIYVYDMCNLTDEEIANLSGDFAEIAKLFTYGFDSCDLNTKLVHPMDTLEFLIAYRNTGEYTEARNKIAMLEKKGDVITMGTIVDEIERNAIIETAKRCYGKLPDDDVIEIIKQGLKSEEAEAKEIFENEVVGLVTV